MAMIRAPFTFQWGIALTASVGTPPRCNCWFCPAQASGERGRRQGDWRER